MKSKLMGAVVVAAGILSAMTAQAAEKNVLTAQEKAEGWQLLFDGKTLDGWRANDKPGTFSVADGELVVHGPRSHLFYNGPVSAHDFKDFELKVDVLTFPKANSGVYFHTAYQDTGWPEKGYEAQVNNSHSDPKRTAGLYNVSDNLNAVAKDGAWFTMTVRVKGKHIETLVDGKPIVDFTEPADWKGPPDNPGRRLGSGTFALQGHDPGSEVHYRNIKVRVLK
jgi:opacity protein-like surface antigen